MPAYTFAYATVDGEQYRDGRVRNGDYLALISIDELRTRMAPDQYGVATIWLPSAWTDHLGDKSWPGSLAQRTAYRRLMALALVHGILDWPVGAHPKERQELLQALDRFGIARARFIGYWNEHNPVRADAPSALVSAYVRQDNDTCLVIVTNVSNEPITTLLSFDGWGAVRTDDNASAQPARGIEMRLDGEANSLSVHVAPRDFRWILLKRR
jgi:hypothetical protein